MTKLSPMAEFTLPTLYAIANISDDTDLSYCGRLLASGVKLLQLRAKTLSDPKLIAIARQLLDKRDRQQLDCRIIINDRVDLCLELKADGVHLGQEDTSPNTARLALGPSAIIGLSNHNLDQIRNAPVEALNYLALGPIFESRTKSGHAPVVGLETLSVASELSPLPLVAIGGITLERAPSVFEAGATAVAIIDDLRATADIRAYLKTISAAKSAKEAG